MNCGVVKLIRCSDTNCLVSMVCAVGILCCRVEPQPVLMNCGLTEQILCFDADVGLLPHYVIYLNGADNLVVKKKKNRFS